MSRGNCSYINQIILLDCGVTYHPAPNYDSPRENYSLHYVLSGCGTLYMNGKEFPLSAGQSFLLFPYVSLSYRPESADFSYTWIDIGGKHADVAFRRTAFAVAHPVSYEYVNMNLQQLFQNIIQADEECQKMSCTYALLAHYIKNFPSHSPNFVQRSHIQEAISYIEGNIRLPINSQTIADYLGISRSHLYRLFTSEIGTTVNHYVQTVRIESACRLLSTTDLTVKDIATNIGFSNPMYFNQVFRKYMGMTPGEYRRRNNKCLPTGQ